MAEPTPSPDAPESRSRAPEWWPWVRTPVLAFSGVIAALVALTAIWGLNVYLTIEGSQQTLDASRTASLDDPWDFGNRPRNVLILGSDSRAGLSPEDQARFGSEDTVGGERSDTIILMSIDPRREQAVIVHFPRDLRVQIPGYGTNKINAAYEFGGPDLVIKTVKQFSGIPIHNYMQVDLAGFQELVDIIGGVRICVDRPMFDDLAGLAIPKAGCYLMDGSDALAYVRARHVTGDVIPDFSRIRRQQQFIRAMLNRVISFGNLLDDEVIRKAVGAVETDGGLETTDLIDLGQRLRQLAEQDPSGARSLDLRVVPGDTDMIGEVSYVVANEVETRQLFEAIREGKSLGTLGQDLALTLPSPGTVKVRVLEVTQTDGGEVEALLRQSGFVVLRTESAYGVPGRSEIIYATDSRDRAMVVQSYYRGLEMREVPSHLLYGAEVGVVVGEDFDRVSPGQDEAA